ncbi:MAG: hypothetical protein PHX30_04285 [Candidatus Pacebacteria bacterium]|nr:hypothetical protein [Candidatus Paceibacterota bacterium]
MIDWTQKEAVKIGLAGKLLGLEENPVVIEGHYEIKKITKTPVTNKIELKEYHLKEKILIVPIPKEISNLITNHKVYEIENILIKSLGNVVSGVKVETTLRFMSSSVHLSCIHFYPTSEWDGVQIRHIMEKTGIIIQKNLPRSTYTVCVDLRK